MDPRHLSLIHWSSITNTMLAIPRNRPTNSAKTPIFDSEVFSNNLQHASVILAKQKAELKKAIDDISEKIESDACKRSLFVLNVAQLTANHA